MATSKEVKKVEPKAPEVKKNTVEVDADVLQALVERVEQLGQAQKEIESTATQDQIRKIEALRASGKLIKAVKLNSYDGRIVKSWRATYDDVYIETGTGKEVAVQKMELTFKDDTTKELPQIDYARRKLQKEYEVVKETKDADGIIWYTVLLEGGEEFTIANPYIN